MRKRNKIYLGLLLVLVLVVVGVWLSDIEHLPIPTPNIKEKILGKATEKLSQTQNKNTQLTATAKPSSSGEMGGTVRAPIPKRSRQVTAGRQVTTLPPSPPMPVLDQQMTNEERKKRVALKDSVDVIVRDKEPFKLAGRTLTIDEIKKRLNIDDSQKVGPHPGLESDHRSVSFVRRPVANKGTDETYYGVRLVRPGENLWDIHYNILREYFARRGVELVPDADEPLPDGRSSGVGRLLKFLENVVYVYDLSNNRLVANLNVIRPDSIVVFFKISEVFAVLDELQPEDLKFLRFVEHHIVLQEPQQTKDLLDARYFR